MRLHRRRPPQHHLDKGCTAAQIHYNVNCIDKVVAVTIVYSIFALYRDTENIHSNMMIWLVIFIISNYSLASSPPKDPGGVKKNIFSESRTLIHRAFSVNQNYQTRFQKSGICIFILCALSATRNCVFSCQKEKKG